MRITSLAISQVGKIRSLNEDDYSCDDKSGQWIVADGVGGHACGDVASKLAIKVTNDSLARGMDLKQAISKAHQEVLAQVSQNPEQSGMGTTLVAAQLSNNAFNLAWIGDSRIYQYQVKSQLQQISIDHSLVQELISRNVLTEQEAMSHPQRNVINRSIGMAQNSIDIDEINFTPQHSGYLLLCTDGVSDYVNYNQLQSFFETSNSIEKIAKLITDAVLDTEAGDNFTFILVKFDLNISKWRKWLK